jgi:hypothetical protein
MDGAPVPLQFRGDLVPPFTYAPASVPVRLLVRWSNGTATRCDGETGCWNADAAYCRFHTDAHGRARVGWFATADVVQLAADPGNRAPPTRQG